MKTKLSVVLLFIFLFCNIVCFIPQNVQAQGYTYARITQDETYLYKSTSNTTDINNVYFELEKTYFVKIIENCNEFYKVSYLDIVGYVVANQVSPVFGTPNNPYPQNITFNINSALNTKIRSSASMTNENNVVGIVQNINSSLTYLGRIKGEESVKTLGDEWFYCYYLYENFGCILGYVYAPLTENLTPILANTETLSDSKEDGTVTPQMPSQQQNIMLVVLMCLPAVIIFILLVIPSKSNANKNTTKPNFKKKSKKDFYEID